MTTKMAKKFFTMFSSTKFNKSSFRSFDLLDVSKQPEWLEQAVLINVNTPRNV